MIATEIIQEIGLFEPSVMEAVYPIIKPVVNFKMCLVCAIYGVRKDIFAYVFNRLNMTDKELRRILLETIKGGHTDLAMMIHERYPQHGDILQKAFNYVCYDNNIEHIRWMLRQGVKPTEECLYIAVKNRSVDIVRLLLDNGASAEWDDNAAFWVAHDLGYREITWMLYDHVHVFLSPEQIQERMDIIDQ